MEGNKGRSGKIINYMNILNINTADNQKISVSINGDSKKTLTADTHLLKAQAVLPLIIKLLKKYRIKLSDISGIKVNKGPGSYTGIRVGLAVANALGYALNIKVNGKETETDGVYEWPQK